MKAAGRAEPWGRARRRRGAQLASGAARPWRRKVSPAPRDERRSLCHGRAPQPRPRSGRLRRGGAHRGAGARGRGATARCARRRECPLLCPSNFLGGATRGDVTASAPYTGDNLEASRLCHRSVRDESGARSVGEMGLPQMQALAPYPRSGSHGFTAGHSHSAGNLSAAEPPPRGWCSARDTAFSCRGGRVTVVTPPPLPSATCGLCKPREGTGAADPQSLNSADQSGDPFSAARLAPARRQPCRDTD